MSRGSGACNLTAAADTWKNLSLYVLDQNQHNVKEGL